MLRQPTEGFFWTVGSVDRGCFPILVSSVSYSTVAGVTCTIDVTECYRCADFLRYRRNAESATLIIIGRPTNTFNQSDW